MKLSTVCLLAAALLAVTVDALDNRPPVLRSSKSGRLVERKLDLLEKPQQLSDTVPIVDPPYRVSGYFKLNRTHDAKLFYFYFQSRTAPATDPVVLWMTGGPGCSSELAVFYENGPYTINKDLSLNETQYGWDVNHNVIFVDQPVNTGFSYSDDPRDRVYGEKQVGEDMLDFLLEFFEVHQEVASNGLFVTGESYAGHYVPAVTHRVWQYNKAGEGVPIALKGMAIGNGLTDAAIQFAAYSDFALQNGLIGQSMYDVMQFWYPVCRWGANLCEALDWSFVCGFAQQVCMMTAFTPILSANPGINVYDITKQCEGSLCYDMSRAEKLLNQPAVRVKLGVDPHREWQQCNYDVYADMMGDWLKAFDGIIPEMMADGVRVMIYAGDLDLICNWLGNKRWVDSLEWEGSETWPTLQEQDWLVEGQAAGNVKQLGPLSFVRVYKAGHMVPMDQPRNALDMITRFTRGKPFAPATDSTTASDATVDDEEPREAVAGAASASHAVATKAMSLVQLQQAAKQAKAALGRRQVELLEGRRQGGAKHGGVTK